MKKTTNNGGEHGHVYEDLRRQVELGAGWCVGDQPWPASYPWPLDVGNAHLLMDTHAGCPHRGQHDPIPL
jgi:hypothetical protein